VWKSRLLVCSDYEKIKDDFSKSITCGNTYYIRRNIFRIACNCGFVLANGISEREQC
jgi:hypothetical protein